MQELLTTEFTDQHKIQVMSTNSQLKEKNETPASISQGVFLGIITSANGKKTLTFHFGRNLLIKEYMNN